MNLNTKGFADGALAGFTAMSNHLDRKADREFRDEQAKKEDERYQNERNYTISRDQEGDRRWNLDWEAKEKHRKDEARKNDRLRKKQEATLDKQDKLADVQYEAAKYKFDSDKARPLAISILEKASGGDFSMLTKENRDRLRGTMFDLDHLLDPERIAAVDRVFNTIQMGVSDPKLANQIANDPNFLRDLDKTFAKDIRVGIGEVDQATGKKIVDKEIEHIALSPNGSGNLVIGLKVTYDDTSTDSKPLTKGHSAKGDDTVLEIPIDKFLGDVHGRYRVSKMIDGSDLIGHYQTLLGGKSTDHSGDYIKQMDKVDEWYYEEQAAINSQIGVKPEQIKAQLAALSQQYQERKLSTGQRYGVLKADSGGNEHVETSFSPDVLDWGSMNDSRAKFLESIPGHVRNAVSVESLNDLYLDWKKSNKAGDAAAARQKIAKLNGEIDNTGEDAGIAMPLPGYGISDGGPTLKTGRPHGLSDVKKPNTPVDKSQFIAQMAPMAQQAAAELGIPAEVLMAQAALETGWGQSLISENGQSSNNLFGIKSHGWDGESMTGNTHEFNENGERVDVADSFRSYDSYAQSFSDFVDFLKSNPRYAEALKHGKAGDVEKFVQGLQQAGYATDPNYAKKILAISQDIKGRQGLNSV